MAWNKTQSEFEEIIALSINKRRDFAYETNFNHEPLHWVNKFKTADYTVNLIFFSLESISLAIERVAIRFQNGGHYVTDKEVESRYNDGFDNLDKYYKEFDSLMLLESSTINEKPKTLFIYNKDFNPEIVNRIPVYLKKNALHCQNLY